MRGIIRIFIVSFLSVILQSCYLIKNAYYFNNLYRSRRDIGEVIKDPKVSDKTKQGLKLVLEILEYANNQGLNTSDKYTQYIDVGDRPVSYLVEAAEADQLKQVTWWFPIVGEVPYLGYYEKKERDEKASLLSKEGYDVLTAEADAFSGLGWIRDPILSSYLEGGEASVANLLFHELTHATLWVPGSVVFNENFASYIADVLTIEFLEKRNRSEELAKYTIKKSDREIFEKWLHEIRNSLENLYSQRLKIDSKELFKKKAQIFNEFLTQKRPKFYRFDYIGKHEWNNAHVLGAALYVSKIKDFARAKSCLSPITVREFLKRVGEEVKTVKDPFEILNKFCKKMVE